MQIYLHKKSYIDLTNHSYNSETLSKLLRLRKSQLYEIMIVLRNYEVCTSIGGRRVALLNGDSPRAAGKVRGFQQNDKTIPNIPASQKCCAGDLKTSRPHKSSTGFSV